MKQIKVERNIILPGKSMMGTVIYRSFGLFPPKSRGHKSY